MSGKSARHVERKGGQMDGLKQAIIERLPYLRRYARALTGSQRIGDEYVRGCLETLVQEPELLSEGGDVATSLFKQFHRFATAVEVSTDEVATARPFSWCTRKAFRARRRRRFSASRNRRWRSVSSRPGPS